MQVTALCSGTEFSCEVPECVDASKECNFRSECSDSSDEKFCGLFFVHSLFIFVLEELYALFATVLSNM